MQNVGQVPPPFAEPPKYADLMKRITKLAEYYTRNGPEFEEMLKTKQQRNPEYAFLFGGDGASFYAWCLYCMSRNLPYDKPLSHGYPDMPASTMAPPPSSAMAPPNPVVRAPAVPPLAPAQAMPDEVASGFATVLDLLNGSQESIKASSSWFMACSMHAEGMADMITERIHHLLDFQNQLFLLYLINDIFFVGPREGLPVDARVTGVFIPRLGDAMGAALRAAAYSEAARNQTMQLLDLWAARAILDVPVVESIRAQALSGAPIIHAPALLPVPLQPHPITPPVMQRGFQGEFPPPVQAGMPINPVNNWAGPAQGLPQHWPGQPWNDGPGWPEVPPSQHVRPHQPPPDMFGPDSGPHHGGPHWNDPLANNAPGPMSRPVVEKDPYDICSFPAGLIPKLLRRHLRYEAPYSPLTPADIDREPPPRIPEKSPHLQLRLQSFHAEVAQFKAGMSRAQFEEKRRDEAPAEDPVDDRLRTQEGGMLIDGSYTGGPELERGGLGSHQSAVSNSANPDLFDSYRRQRSGRYHTTMASKSTNPNRPALGH